MRWTSILSPLDQTIESLEWIVLQMRRDLLSPTEIPREHYLGVANELERLVNELRPLQDVRIQERKG